MANYDFIAIGDTTTDAFIQLDTAASHIDMHTDVREICMRFADKVPYKDVFIVPAVGNSANAAVSAARLGLKTALVANIGDDYFGKECLDVFQQEQVGTEYVKIHAGRKTNYHYVLWYETDRTILVKHEEYPYTLPDIGAPKWVYLSSLGGNSLDFHAVIAEYLARHPEIKFAFQPGTYQMKFGKEAMAPLYARTDIFFCNKEEAQRILGIEENDVKKLMTMLAALGPKIIAVTDGTAGAYAYEGTQAWFMPPYPDAEPPIQRTGAGDAFSSTFTVALALGKNVPEALLWGPINSMSVVHGIGARQGLLTRTQLEKYLAQALPEYQPREI
ncbi:MAG: hypothetical protein A3J10_03385 [Candidatus Sungbacteria bacterium RIFCSPLOWO2_02_FULL_54_10]|nr:MAG: hypothetical protein A3J10_03385 [Candidatus Sungbacteria bacterium RIFCSPLOWO2_02_FULL_54_10]